MSKAKTNKGKKAGGDVEADDVKFSQRTVSSGDESGAVAAVAKQMQVHWNKKKKDKEARFIELLEQELRTTLKLGVEEYSESVAELDGIYANFLRDYATANDNIRDLWSQIIDRQSKLKDLVVTIEKAHVPREKRREERHVQGMLLARRACKDYEQIAATVSQST